MQFKHRMVAVWRRAHGSIAEFAPALLLLVLFVIAPAVALIRFGAEASCIAECTARAADAAAEAPSYALAQRRADQVIRKLVGSPSALRAGLRSEDLQDVGLSSEECSPRTGQVTTFGAGQPIPGQLHPEIDTYQFKLTVSYRVQPLFVLGDTPWLRKIPLLGAPATITTVAVRAVENPEALPR